MQRPDARETRETRLSYTSKKSAKYGLVWERDAEVSACRGCMSPFSVTFRRHHCRSCGKIFCGTCSSERASVSGSNNAKRVCKWCKLKLAPTGFNRLSLDSDAGGSLRGAAGEDEEGEEGEEGEEEKGEDAAGGGGGGRGGGVGESKKNWGAAAQLQSEAVGGVGAVANGSGSTATATTAAKRPRATMLGSDRLKQLLAIDGNGQCVDCQSAEPEWASLSHGTVLCLHCSGQHRGYGVHISFVRSLKLDKWEEDQVKAMMLGGNRKFWDFVAPLRIVSGEDSVGQGGDGGGGIDNEKDTEGGSGTKEAASAASAAASASAAAASAAAASAAAAATPAAATPASATPAAGTIVTGESGDEKKWAQLISCQGIAYRSQRAAYYREMLASVVKGIVPPPDVPERYDVAAATAAAVAAAAAAAVESEVEDGASGAGGMLPHSSANGGAATRVNMKASNIKESRRPEWAPDKAVKECMHCQAPFSLFRRRHHCRKCGDCVCSTCAPSDNTRPMPEMGYSGEVRLCLECFCPPSRRAMMATAKKEGAALKSGE